MIELHLGYGFWLFLCMYRRGIPQVSPKRVSLA